MRPRLVVWLAALCVAVALVVATRQASAASPDPRPSAGSTADSPDAARTAAEPEATEPAAEHASGAAGETASAPPSVGISANPGAVNVTTGTGWLGRMLRADAIPGVRLGGVWIGDVNFLLDGGVDPGTTADSLLIVDLSVDLDRSLGIPGADFGSQFLQFNASDTNGDAGVVTGYNSLIAAPPFNRTELYQLWWRQRLFDDRLVVRVGKSVPTYDFGNVSRPVPVGGPSGFIPSVSGLIYTPLFVNPTTLGVIPGYYDSAYGVTATVIPDKSFYTSFGIYDGNLARGVHTGQTFTPDFSGYYFGAGEAGYSWLLGRHAKPGKLAAGAWLQTGELEADEIEEDGTYGFYAYGSQRLWYRDPGVDNSGVSAFLQVGLNDSRTLPADRFVGLGVTGFGLIRGRPADSMGAGLAWSWLNTELGLRSNELILAAYYQAHLFGSVYFQPTLTYVPNPGASPDVSGAVALTSRITVLF